MPLLLLFEKEKEKRGGKGEVGAELRICFTSGDFLYRKKKKKEEEQKSDSRCSRLLFREKKKKKKGRGKPPLSVKR